MSQVVLSKSVSRKIVLTGIGVIAVLGASFGVFVSWVVFDGQYMTALIISHALMGPVAVLGDAFTLKIAVPHFLKDLGENSTLELK